MIHNPELPIPETVIPHRPPHLWLSGVVEVEPNVRAHGFWLPDNEHFEGHFEAMPLLMGVKQLESLAQLGAYTMMVGSDKPLLGIYKGVEKAEFMAAVRPGQALELSIEITDRDRKDFKGRGVASLEDGKVTCEATIIGSLMPAKVAERLFGASPA